VSEKKLRAKEAKSGCKEKINCKSGKINRYENIFGAREVKLLNVKTFHDEKILRRGQEVKLKNCRKLFKGLLN